jgi:polyisoprenoid-binding protein YceI
VVPLAALIALLVRWLLQGSGNVYTAREQRFWVKDPDLDWRVSSDTAIWVGLEVCGIVAAIACGLVAAGWIIRRRERKTQHPAKLLRAAAWVAAVVPLAVPMAAFASGWGPAGGHVIRPAIAAKTELGEGIAGSIAAPSGRYEVVAHEGTSIVARLEAGGDSFDAQFARDLTGSWQGDPRDLTKPMTAELRAAAAAVDTGIGDRTKHAREGYLQADKYPHITFALDKILTAKQDGPDTIAFRARATVGLIGKTHAVEVTGTLRKADAATLGRLHLTGEILLAKADFTIVIKETGLDAGDFDGDVFPIHVSLVLRHTSG